jgi:hypothetical protein
MQEIVISLVADVARNFIHDSHADLYLRWKRVTVELGVIQVQRNCIDWGFQ